MHKIIRVSAERVDGEAESSFAEGRKLPEDECFRENRISPEDYSNLWGVTRQIDLLVTTISARASHPAADAGLSYAPFRLRKAYVVTSRLPRRIKKEDTPSAGFGHKPYEGQ